MDVFTLSTAELLEVIGWSPAKFAEKLGRINKRTAQRMASGVNVTPDNVRNWLMFLAQAHVTKPLPEDWTPPCQRVRWT